MSALQERLQVIQRLKNKGVLTDEEFEAERSAILDEWTAEPSVRARAFRFELSGCLGMSVAVGIVILCLYGLVALIAVSAFRHDGGDRHTPPADTHVSLSEGSSGTVKTLSDVENRVTIVRVTDPAVPNQLSLPRAGYHAVSVEVALTTIGERELWGGGGDFASSFVLRSIDGTDHEPNVINAVLTFEVPDGSPVDWLRFNPNLFFGSVYFEK